jgi:ArsR family transcriptional regulator
MKTHELFKSLAEPMRLRIAILLLEQELCVCDLMAVLQLPQSTVSRHMSRLKSAGLVVDRREGKWVYYRYEETNFINELRALIKKSSWEVEIHRRDLVKLREYLLTKRRS